jgi:hypothetical protein
MLLQVRPPTFATTIQQQHQKQFETEEEAKKGSSHPSSHTTSTDQSSRKKTMTKSKLKKAVKSAKEAEERLEHLHRFAGSSAEEDSDDENVDHSEEEEDADEAVAMKPDDRDHGPADDEDSSDDNKGIDNEEEPVKLGGGKEETNDNLNEDSSDEEEGDSQKAPGMANAMARILGTTASGRRGTKPVVLSKTTTRIQKQAALEKVRVKEMKEKRLVNREKELQALHIPLSVATSHQVADTSKALVKELEMERVHRRVATRGVVALFNAIAQHQNKEIKESSTLLSSSQKDVQKMSKHGFLDMLKNKATASDVNSTSQETKDAPAWKALQDDYMLNPKKNWDEESSDDDDDDDGEDGPPEKGRDAKGNMGGKRGPPNKKRRTAVRFS